MPRPCTRILIRAAVFWVAVLSAVFFGLAGAARPASLPFKVGEQIEYTISWENVPAGTACFRVLDHRVVKGEKTWHFELTARSNRFVDIIYKIRDRLESFTDADFSRSVLYKKTQTGRADKKVVVWFDWEKRTATYANHGGKRPSIAVPDQTFDPLASFYKLRTLDLKNQNALFFPVSDGKKCFIQKGEILKKESLTIASGTYDTYLVLPSLTHFSGVFEKSKDAKIQVWVSADKRRIPVRIKSKVVVGSFIGELISASGLVP